MSRILSLIGSTAVILCMVAYPVRSQAGMAMALPNCIGKPEVKPTEIIFTCADANFRVESLKWTGWGETFTAAVGTASVNDCEPNCAQGHSHTYPMVVIASGKQTCANGQPAYSKVVHAFIGRSPFPNDAPGMKDATTDFPCKAMP